MKELMHLLIKLQNLVLGDDMKKIKNIKEKIESNVVFKILKWIINIIVILLLLIIIVQKVTKNNFAVGGIRIFMVVSGSMVDEYNSGDILISKATDEEICRDLNLPIEVVSQVMSKPISYLRNNKDTSELYSELKKHSLYITFIKFDFFQLAF